MPDSPAQRLAHLRMEIVYALERGEYPSDQVDAFRFLWRTTPDSERNGLGFTLKDLEEMVENLRLRSLLRQGAGKLRSVSIKWRDPDADHSGVCR